MSYNERKRIKLGICVMDFVCLFVLLIQGVLDLNLYRGVLMKKIFCVPDFRIFVLK